MNDKVQGEGTSSDVSGESRQLQLVFVDLVGSTELSSTMEAEDFAALLLMFQDLSRRIFRSFGGQVSNVMGDGLLIYFGYPQAHENDAERAVRASLNLIAALRQLHSHDVSLSARVGIHSGTVVIGDDASGGGAIFGEAVNVAARIEGAAEAGTVLVSDPILAQLRDKYVAKDQGEHNLRGLRDPLRLYRVVRPRSAHLAPTMAPAQLFGRDEQRAQLNNLWDRACRDGPLAVTVMGEPGMGKTSLLSAFHSSLGAVRHVWLQLQCDALMTGSALYPIITLIRRTLGIPEGGDDADAIKKLERTLTALPSPLDQTLPVMARLLELDGPHTASLAGESPESLRRRTLDTLGDWIAHIAADRQTVLAIEDLHWSDASTISFVDHVLSRLQDTPLFCIVTSRPGYPDAKIASSVETIELSELTAQDAEQLIRHSAPTGTLDDTRVDTILARAQGIPLFLEELAQSTDAVSGRVRSAVPATLSGLVMHRLDGMTADVKRIAQIAATLGQDFDLSILSAVSERSAPEIEAAVADLVDADILRAKGASREEFTFRHALTREAAYGTLLREEREALHAVTAERVLTDFPKRAEMQPGVVAHHLLEARQPTRAADWFRTAGLRAAKQAAVEDAASLYRRALAALDGAPSGTERDQLELSLQILLGNALMGVRGFGSDEIVPVWERAHALAEALGDRDETSSALNGLAAYYIGKGDCKKSVEFADRILARSEPEGDRIGQLRAHSSLANAKFQIGDVAEAEDHAERAISLYSADDFATVTYGVGTDQGVVAYGAAAASHWWLGRTEMALARAHDGVNLAEGLESSLSLAAARSYLALIHHYRGDEKAAFEMADQTVCFCVRMGIPFWHGLCLMLRAGQSCNPPEKRLRDIDDGLSVLAQTGSQSAVGLGFSVMADARLANGEPEIALAILGTGLQMSAMLGQHFWDVELTRLKGVAEQASDKVQAAATSFTDALEMAEARGAHALALRTALEFTTHPDLVEQAPEVVGRTAAQIEPGSTTPDMRKAQSNGCITAD